MADLNKHTELLVSIKQQETEIIEAIEKIETALQKIDDAVKLLDSEMWEAIERRR